MSPPRPWLAAIIVFALGFPALWTFHNYHPVLYDNDAYYHLAIGRTIAQEGVPEVLPQLRYSLLGDGFGDKELLFHIFLAPFAAWDDPVAGGRAALALLEALLAATAAALGVRALGWWGFALPLWLPFASTELAWRLVRLRPELPALLLLLLALWAAGKQRYRLVGLLALVFTLAYTAFHAFVGLMGLLFLFTAWARRRTEWGLLLYPLLGAGAGLLLHPNFPVNLEVWVVQSIDFFQQRGTLDVGTEIRPNFMDVVLLVNLGWFLGLAVLWRAAESGVSKADVDPEADPEADGLADAFGVAAVVFGLLYCLMSRFSLYALPFATFWLLFTLRRRGRRPGPWLALPGRGRIPTAVALALCLLVSLPEARRQLATFAVRTAPGPENVRLRDREAVGAALPAGANVIASWRQTPIYLLWAPQARYLNVLDPVFMAAPYPEQHQVQQRIFAGLEPDLPLAAAVALDSDHIAFSRATAEPAFVARLAADPRVLPRHVGSNAVYVFVPGANERFILDWYLVPPGTVLPPSTEQTAAFTQRHPRPTAPLLRTLEGYVDARRTTSAEACASFVHTLNLDTPAAITFELAPYGRATFWVDGEELVTIEDELRAVLGRGVVLPLHFEAGDHQLVVQSCPGAGGANGFYLLERERSLQAR